MFRTTVARVSIALFLSTMIACGGDEVVSPGSVTLTLSQESRTLVAGQTSTVNLSLQRTRFTGDVALAVEGLPTGVTGTFAPATLSGTTATAVLTLAANGNAQPGTTQLSVKATGSGVATSVASLSLTVNAASAIAIAATNTSIPVTRGAEGSTTLTLTRSGGVNGDVALAVSGAVAGMTATVNPATLSGAATSATLTVSTTNATPTGTHTLTVQATATGAAPTSATVDVVVSAPPAGQSIALDFCDADDAPIWFAYKNEGAAWTRVLPDANYTFRFEATDRFAIASVTKDGDEYSTEVVYATRADLASVNGVTCSPLVGTRRLTGTVANVGNTRFATVQMGLSMAMVPGALPNFELDGLLDRPLDLVAGRYSASGALEKVIVRRDISTPNGGTLSVVDFDATEAAAPASATITIGQLSSDAADVMVGYATAGGTIGMLSFGSLTSGSTITGVGLPGSLLSANDAHFVDVMATADESGTVWRRATNYMGALVATTLQLGAALAPTTLTSAGSAPYLRIDARMARQADYSSGISIAYDQSSAGRYAAVAMTAAYAGTAATEWEVPFPVFGSVAGWNDDWGLKANAETSSYSLGFGGGVSHLFGGTPAKGSLLRSASHENVLSQSMTALRAPLSPTTIKKAKHGTLLRGDAAARTRLAR